MIEREIDNPIPIPLDLVVKKGFDVREPHHCDGLAHELWMSGEMLREVSDAPGLEVIKGRLDLGEIVLPDRYSCSVENVPISALALAQLGVGSLTFRNVVVGLHRGERPSPFVPATAPGLCDSTAVRLFARGLSQRFIDSLLPTRAAVLEMIENVPINTQRDELFGVRDRRAFRSRLLQRLGRCRLKRGFGRLQRVLYSS
jgi:hypothetical protein